MTTADSAYEAIKNHPALPSPRGVAMEILRLARNKKASLLDLTNVVEKDPAIASRIIKLVNSSAFPHNRPIVSLTEAIAYLGTRMVECIALSFSLLSTENHCRAFDYRAFWSASLARAVAGNKIAQHAGGILPDEAFTICLLSQLGRLVFACTDPAQYTTLLTSIVCNSADELMELERELFGIDHNDLTARLMADWGWPTNICDAIRSQDGAETRMELQSECGRLAGLLYLARCLSEFVNHQASPESYSPGLLAAAREFNISPEALIKLTRSVVAQWREMIEVFNLEELAEVELDNLYNQASALQQSLTAASG
jgi:two-component system, cell cycle response regulator